MNDLEINIINQLRNNHRGKDNAVTYKRLASVIGVNSRELRQAVSELVTHYHYLIGTSQEGYWYIDNDEEYQQAHDELISRIKKLSKRAKGLRLGHMRIKQQELAC